MSQIWIIALYAVVAVAAFAITIYLNRRIIADAADDDPVGAALFMIATALLSAVWPMTLALLAAVGAFVGVVHLIARVVR